MSCTLPRCCGMAVLLLIAGTLDRELHAQAPASSPALHTFTDRSGRQIEAFYLGLSDGKVQIRRKDDGKTFAIDLSTLSEADQAWVGLRASAASAAVPGRGGTEPQSEIERATQDLCEQIVASYKAGTQTRIAVVEFADLRGGVTDFGRLLAEELITRLFSQKYNVVERFLLNKAIEEHKLQLQGLVDPDSAKQLGKILGVDAIVTGTVADLGTSLRVNARLIATETGAVFSAAAVTIQKTAEVQQLIAAGPVSRPAGTTMSTPRAAPSANGQVSLADLGYQSAVLADLATSLRSDAIRKALESRFGTLHETEEAYFIPNAGARGESAWVFAGGRILAASKRSLQDGKVFAQLALTWTDVTGTIATVSADIQPADVRTKLENLGEVFTQQAHQCQTLRVVSPGATGWVLDWPDAKPQWAEIVCEGSNSYWAHQVVIDQQTVISNKTAQPLGQSLIKLAFGRHVVDVKSGRGSARFEISAYFPQPNGRIKLYDRANQSMAQREVYSQPIANVRVPAPPQ